MLKKPVLTPTMRAELDGVCNKKNVAISDIDDIVDGNWDGAVRGVFRFAKNHTANDKAEDLFRCFDDDVIELLLENTSIQDYKRINGVLRCILTTA